MGKLVLTLAAGLAALLAGCVRVDSVGTRCDRVLKWHHEANTKFGLHFYDFSEEQKNPQPIYPNRIPKELEDNEL